MVTMHYTSSLDFSPFCLRPSEVLVCSSGDWILLIIHVSSTFFLFVLLGRTTKETGPGRFGSCGSI